MPTINLSLPVAATTVTAGLHSSNYAALQTLLNGGLDTNNISPTAGITAGQLAAGVIGGAEKAYVESASDVTVTATSEASPNDVISSGAITYTAVKHKIEFYCSGVDVGSAAFVQFNLWDGSTDLGRLYTVRASGAVFGVYVARYLTPSAGSHTYKVRAIVNTGTGTVNAGAGGVAADVPIYIRTSIA